MQFPLNDMDKSQLAIQRLTRRLMALPQSPALIRVLTDERAARLIRFAFVRMNRILDRFPQIPSLRSLLRTMENTYLELSGKSPSERKMRLQHLEDELISIRNESRRIIESLDHPQSSL